jgi:hypothetical protein
MSLLNRLRALKTALADIINPCHLIDIGYNKLKCNKKPPKVVHQFFSDRNGAPWLKASPLNPGRSRLASLLKKSARAESRTARVSPLQRTPDHFPVSALANLPTN